ncbi:MAG TPA: LpqB family beta-propeller domain-containing protein [Chloroflexota bacterium]|jgi:TolB protein
MRALASMCAGLLLLLPAARAVADDGISGRILFIKDGDLWLLDGSGPRQLATGGTFSQPSWAPDGNSLAYVYRGNNFADIFVTDDQGENQTRLTDSQSTVLDNNDWNLRPSFSPDGQSIAFVSDHNSALPTLSLINADGSNRRALATPGLQEEDVDALAWSPDGSQLAFTMFNEPGPTQIGIASVPSSGNQQAARVLTTQAGGALDPAWSPDGNWLAFAGHDGLNLEIYALQPGNADAAPTRLTSDGLLARSPVWSPDGQHIAYLSNKTGNYEIYVIDVSLDASGNLVASQPKPVTKDQGVDAASGISWGH